MPRRPPRDLPHPKCHDRETSLPLGRLKEALVHSLGGRIVLTSTEPRQWRSFVASLRDGHSATIDPTRQRQGAALIEEMGHSDQIAPAATDELIALHTIDDEIGDGAAVAYRVSCPANTAVDTAAILDPSSSDQRDKPYPHS